MIKIQSIINDRIDIAHNILWNQGVTIRSLIQIILTHVAVFEEMSIQVNNSLGNMF